jgi:hypothetical protein
MARFHGFGQFRFKVRFACRLTDKARGREAASDRLRARDLRIMERDLRRTLTEQEEHLALEQVRSLGNRFERLESRR